MLVTAIVLCAIWAIVIPTFWTIWSRQSHDAEALPPGYLDHERAFLLPDLTLATLLTATAVLGILRLEAMTITGLVAAGMLLFLGLIDLAYDLAHQAKLWEYLGDLLMILSAAALATLLTLGAAS